MDTENISNNQKYLTACVLRMNFPIIAFYMHAMHFCFKGGKITRKQLLSLEEWEESQRYFPVFIKEHFGNDLYRGFVSKKDDMYLPLLQQYLQRFEHELLQYELALYLVGGLLMGLPFGQQSKELAMQELSNAYNSLWQKLFCYFGTEHCYEMRSLQKMQMAVYQELNAHVDD